MMNDTHAEPEFRNVTVIGGGVIGISRTALFLAHGLQVTVSDPLPDVQDGVYARLREIAPTLDDVVTSSIGMGWAVAGPFRTFHLGGGPGGLPDFLVHL